MEKTINNRNNSPINFQYARKFHKRFHKRGYGSEKQGNASPSWY